MKTSTRIIGLILGAALFAPAAAFARDRDHDHDHDRDHGRNERVERRWENRDYRRVPPPPPDSRGRYEWQAVSTWVDGRWEQQYVPGQCVTRPFTGRERCWDGHYENRWVPGHYENVQQWVWVSLAPGWHGYRG